MRLSSSRLVSEDEIHAAAVWRLASWSQDEIAAGRAGLASLPSAALLVLDSAQPDVAQLIRRLRKPKDRRDAWSALCALVVFHAEAASDAALFWRAGLDVLQSYRQASRGHVSPAPDALDEILREYLSRHPRVSTRQLFEHCARLASTRMIVVEATDDALTYEGRNGQLRTVHWHAFEVRVSRLRKREMPTDMAPSAMSLEEVWRPLSQMPKAACSR